MKYSAPTLEEAYSILCDIRVWLQSGATIRRFNSNLPVLVKQEDGSILGNLKIDINPIFIVKEMWPTSSIDTAFKDNEIK